MFIGVCPLKLHMIFTARFAEEYSALFEYFLIPLCVIVAYLTLTIVNISISQN
jgi:hypothetical protein